MGEEGGEFRAVLEQFLYPRRAQARVQGRIGNGCRREHRIVATAFPQPNALFLRLHKSSEVGFMGCGDGEIGDLATALHIGA